METIISLSSESEYNEILRQAVAVIEAARTKVAKAVVSTSNEMHWNVGRILHEKKLDSKHGDSVVKRLSVDLKAAFPKMGMSVSNLWNMKRFYVRFHNSDSKLQQAVVVLPWGLSAITSMQPVPATKAEEPPTPKNPGFELPKCLCTPSEFYRCRQ